MTHVASKTLTRHHKLLMRSKSSTSIPFCVVLTCMMSICWKQFKIAYSVIKYVFIFMMNCLSRTKNSSKVFFHYYPMLWYSACFGYVRMVGTVNIYVSTNKSFTSSPLWVHRSKFGVTLDRAVNLLSIICKKIVVTCRTSLSNSKFIFSLFLTELTVSAVTTFNLFSCTKTAWKEILFAIKTLFGYDSFSHSISFPNIMIRAGNRRYTRHDWLVSYLNLSQNNKLVNRKRSAA